MKFRDYINEVMPSKYEGMVEDLTNLFDEDKEADKMAVEWIKKHYPKEYSPKLSGYDYVETIENHKMLEQMYKYFEDKGKI